MRLVFEDLEQRLVMSGAPHNPAFDVVHLYDLRSDPTFATIDGSGIGIANIDTGIYASNPDLSGNVKGWYDAFGASSTPVDSEGHGSHTAGTEASTDPNIGVAYNANLYAIRGLNGPFQPNYDTVAAGLQWVLDHYQQDNILVVNMSLATSAVNLNSSAPADTNLESRLIAQLEADGVTIVSASGNSYADYETTGASFPAINSTLSVGSVWANNGTLVYPDGTVQQVATQQHPVVGGGPGKSQHYTVEYGAQADQLSVFSQRSTLPNQVFAPGEEIYSTYNGTGDKAHAYDFGTSMAAPLVSGMVALMQQAAFKFGGRYLTPDQIQSIVTSTSDTIVDSPVSTNYRAGFDQQGKPILPLENVPSTGLSYKRVNIEKAIEAVQRLVSTPSNPGGTGTNSADTNNTVATAINGPSLDGTTVYTGSGTIGQDGSVVVGPNDVDLFKVTTSSTGSLIVQLGSAGNGHDFSAAIRLFDSSGREIAPAATAVDSNGYPEVGGPVLPAGTYYFAISSAGNVSYNITDGSGAANGAAGGEYSLAFTLYNPDPNGVIEGATMVSNLVAVSQYTPMGSVYSGDIGTDPPARNSTQRVTVGPQDVDMFAYVAPDDGWLIAQTYAAANPAWSGLKSAGGQAANTYLRVFDASGTEIGANDDYGGTTDSYLSVHVQKGQTYYIGVSDSAASQYDPKNPYRPQAGYGGLYQLGLSFDNGDRNGTVLTATAFQIGTTVNGVIGTDFGGPTIGRDGSRDVDFEAYTPSTSGYLDVQATSPDQSMTPVLSLWTVNSDQTDVVKIAESKGTDAHLDYAVTAGTTYYVAVTGLGNQNFAWYSVGTGSGGQTGRYTLTSAIETPAQVAAQSDNSINANVPGVISVGDTLSGNIGMDNSVVVGPADIDLYQFTATVTETVDITALVPLEGSLDPNLRVFDSSGNQMAVNDDRATGDRSSEIKLAVVAGRTYYVGVNASGPNDNNYNPLTGQGAAAGNSTGDYLLSIQSVPEGTVVDNLGAGFGETGPWTAAKTSVSYNGGYDYAAPGNGSSRATWTAPGLSPGLYDVQVTWGAGTNRATNAPYQIYDGTTLLATIPVNQKLAPAGPVVGGVSFQSLGVYQVTSGTLRVVLSNAADGYLIADAIRVASPPVVDNLGAGFSETGPWTAAKTSVSYNGGYDYAAPGNGSSRAIWTAPGLSPGLYDVQVTWGAGTNRATNAPYQIYDGTTLLATIPVNQKLVPAGPVVGGVSFQSLGVYRITSGALRVVLSNAANGYVIADAMRVALPPVADNLGAGFSETGTWTAAKTSVSYNGGYDYAAPGNGSSRATWTAPGLSPGLYDVQVTWGAGTNRATNAPYQIYDGTTLLATIPVNQKLAPAGPVVGGVSFQSLGVYRITSGALRVVLSNAANGYVIADAMRVALPPVADNLGAGFSETGTWTAAKTSASYNGGYDYAAPGSGASTATWTYTGLSSGSYNVQVTWGAGSNRATNAVYQIFDNTTLLGTVTINQQLTPSGILYGGVIFQSLGTFKISSGILRVVLSNQANGYVIADAVLLT